MESNLTEIENQLLLITRQFLLEQETERALRAVSLTASLEKQLGIDSLSKVELFNRFEKVFNIQLSNKVVAESDNLKQVAEAILHAEPAKHFFSQHSVLPKLVKTEVSVTQLSNLVDVLKEYALYEPNRPHIYLQDENGKEEVITYGDLLADASIVATNLQNKGLTRNDTIAIMLPTGKTFFATFFGALLMGAIPVPIYPPFRADRIAEYAKREVRILNNACIRALVTFDQAELLSKVLQTEVQSLQWVLNGDRLLEGKGAIPNIKIDEHQAALIQYSSGSTGDPKGVLLFHKNVLANIRSINQAIELQPTDCVVSWLPLYHDMGLMSWINSLYFGVPITILSPLTFLNRPERWLWALHYHRGTISAAPNFAYELCMKKIEPEMIEGLDLSAWRYALNGAEAVNPKTMHKFAEKFKRYGFKAESFYPVYGLAENTVALVFPEKNSGIQLDTIAKDRYEKEQLAIPDAHSTFGFVCEGKVIPNHAIRIVNEEGNIVPDRHVGEIQFQGPSSMKEYYRNPAATDAAFHHGWWATGDLGYLVQGNLYVTGRKKDLIIKAGRNINPEMLEEVAGTIQGVRQGCVIAFGIQDEKSGTEKIVIVAETGSDKDQYQVISDAMMEKMSTETGVPPDEILLVKPRTIPKTSSGKLQRSACKQMYLNNELTKKSKTFHLQMLQLMTNAFKKSFTKYVGIFFKSIYTVYMWFILFSTFIPFFLMMMLFSKRYANYIAKAWCRLMMLLSGLPLKVENTKNLSDKNQLIYVANHASYMDSLILLAILPVNTIFVGKKELGETPIFSAIMKKLNFITVDRLDFSNNIEDTKRIADALSQHKSIMIFPEGTFTYANGIRPFKAGAFQLSVEKKIPICPIGIQNTRQVWRSGAKLFSPHKLKVIISNPIQPENDEWQSVVKLKTEARRWIADAVNEPLLNI